MKASVMRTLTHSYEEHKVADNLKLRLCPRKKIDLASYSSFSISISPFLFAGMAGCYFPLEFQGEFLTQSMTSLEIAYTSVSILFDSIPTWGSCHRRLGSHVILASSSGRGPAEEQDCFKCISIVSRSPNVLQLHTNGLEKCHATEEAAKASCPSRQEIRYLLRTNCDAFFKAAKCFPG
jgi:hypothetical protein